MKRSLLLLASRPASGSRRSAGLLLGAILSFTLFAVSGGRLRAQESTSAGVFLPTEGEYQILFQRLEKSRKEEDWDAVVDGLARYADLVRRPRTNPVISSGGGIAFGIRRLFARLVAALPPAELKRYRERLDSLLSDVWKESLADGDPSEHRNLRHRVLRDYKQSLIYPLALADEIDDAFERGRWRSARRACEDLIALSEEEGSRPVTEETVVRARLFLWKVCAVLGDANGAGTQAAALRMTRDSKALDRLPEDVRSAVDSVIGSAPAAPAPAPRPVDAGIQSPLEPLVLSGPARPSEPGGYRLGSVIWQRRAVGSKLRPFMAERARSRLRGDVPLPYYAVARDGLIVFQHADRLAAFDTRSGRELWAKDLDPDAEDFGEMRSALIGSSACYHVRGRTLHALRRSDGSPLWERHFVYDRGARSLDLSSTSPEKVDPGEGAAAPAGDEPGKAAVDPPQEEPAEKPAGGKSSKDAGDEPPKDASAGDEPLKEEEPAEKPAGDEPSKDAPAGDEPVKEEAPPGDGAGAPREPKDAKKPGKGALKSVSTAAAYSLSPPVFIRDRIVLSVKVRIDQETLFYLTAIDLSGEEAWTSFLGSAQRGNYLGLGGAASIPLAHGDVVYHLTNMGFVAAVDGEDGTLLWIGEYPKLGARGRRESIRAEDRWQPNPILPIGSELVIAPQDSPYLVALEKSSGDVTWQAPREEGSTLVGADSAACFIAGSEVSAILHSGPARGRVRWRFRVEEPGPDDRENGRIDRAPLGRAFLTPDALLLPARSALYRLSPVDGSFLSRTLWDFTGGGGNLLLTGNLLAVTNPEGFLVYCDLSKEKAMVEGLPADRTETLLEKAKFHLKNGEIAAGLGVLGSWAGSAPPAPAPNSVLDHLHLDLAEMVDGLSETREAKAWARELLRYRVRLERTPQRKVEAAISLADRMEKEGDVSGALSALHEALAYDNPATEYTLEAGLRVPSAAYVREKIGTLRRSAGPDQVFAGVDSAAREALRDARKKGTPTSYVEVIRLYPFTPPVAEAYLDLSVCFRDRQSYDQAIKALEGYLADYPGGQETVRAKLLIASLLHQSGRRSEARKRYEELLEQHASSPVVGALGRGFEGTVAEYVRPILRDSSFADSSAEEPPELKFPIRMAWRSPADLHATNRVFLQPRGDPPPGLKDCFLTQSGEVIDCRSVETGLPLWKVYLEMIPGFAFDDSSLGLRFRTGRRAILGTYVAPQGNAPSLGTELPLGGALLVLHDDWNIFAVDPLKGTVRWHTPFEANRSTGTGPQDLLRQRLWGASVTEAGVFAMSSWKQLIHLDLQGKTVWTVNAEYEPAQLPPVVHGDDVFVHSRRPTGIRIHDRVTGKAIGKLDAADGVSERIATSSEPIELPGGRLLLPFEEEIKVLGLRDRKMAWTYRRPRSKVAGVFYFPESPAECIAVLNRPNDWPALVALSLSTGEELWRYEKFPAQRARFSVFRKRERLYVVYGEDRWQLLALEVRRGDDAKPMVDVVWPKEIQLGMFYSGSVQRRLHIAGDAIFFADVADERNAISVYDAATGASRTASAGAIARFLRYERANFSSALLGGKLIILTDGGDSAFESAPGAGTIIEGETDMRLVKRYLESPGALESTSRLALQYFRQGDQESAMNLLNRALLSEDLLQENGAQRRFLLSYLLDGIKEDHMKDSVPRIVCRRLRTPPAIDGEMNDAWDVSSRIHLSSPRHVGTIPGPGQLRDWEGEEDLSAHIYTGWDEQYFYFAMDVEDDVLHPYDKDADNWKGDCLLIGLDPDGDGGATQRGNDQLMTLALTIPKRNKLDKQKKPDGEKGDEEDEDESERKPDGLFSVKKKEDDSGAVYEVALPWSSFSSEFQKGAPPPEGYAFGLSLLLIDDDTGQGAMKTLSINSCHLLPRSQKNSWVWRFIIPFYFPRVTLE